MSVKDKEASAVTKALAGPHLDDIERLADALKRTRATVIRSIIHQWFEEHPGAKSVRDLPLFLQLKPIDDPVGTKKRLLARAYALATSLGFPKGKDGSVWPSYAVDDIEGKTTTRIPSPADPDIDEDIKDVSVRTIEDIVLTLERIYEKSLLHPVKR